MLPFSLLRLIPTNEDIREKRGRKDTPSLVSIRGTGWGDRGATAIAILGPSRQDLSIGVEPLVGSRRHEADLGRRTETMMRRS